MKARIKKVAKSAQGAVKSTKSFSVRNNQFSKLHLGLFGLVFACIGAYAIISIFASGTATLSLTPTTSTVNAGSNFTVSIYENSGSTEVNAVQADLNFPKDKLQFVSIDSAGSAFAVEAASSGDNANGTVTIARGANSAPLTGNQLVAKVTFKAIGAGAAAVSFAGSSAVVESTGNTDILSSKAGGTYTVVGNPATLSVTPTPSTVAVGNNLVVSIHENSNTVGVNAVQANLKFPKDNLEFVSIDVTGSAFPVQAVSSGDNNNGTVTIARGVTGTALTGSQLIAKVTFKAKATGSASVSFEGSSALVEAASNTNILAATNGGTYTINATFTKCSSQRQPRCTSTPGASE